MAENILYDKDIREPLFEFLEEKFGKIRIFEEKQIGKSRADVVMITPTDICGIEIKSDADTYTRLSRQVKDYNSHYDLNYVVVGSSHALHVKEHVSEWWGIITVELDETEKVDFYVLREAVENPQVDPKEKIGVLWRPELCHILEKNDLPKYARESKVFVQDKILAKVPGEILWPMVCEELFERDYTTIHDKINEFRQAIGQKKRRRKSYRRKRKNTTKGKS